MLITDQGSKNWLDESMVDIQIYTITPPVGPDVLTSNFYKLVPSIQPTDKKTYLRELQLVRRTLDFSEVYFSDWKDLI